ncbi:MAG: ABC transporter ATP-binding protein [Eubacteriales bacterium]|nr:ABC transporter ATP-binding protein [Eubacteriales bacterium]
MSKENKTRNETLKQEAEEKLNEVKRRLSVSDMKGTLKRILAYTQQYKWLFIFALFFKAVRSGLSVAANALLKPVVNAAVNQGMSEVLRYILLMAIVYLGSVIAFYLGERLINKMGENVIQTVRSDLFSHMQKLPLSFFDSRSHGDLMSAYTNDVENLSTALQESLGTLVTQSVSFIGTLIVMLWLSPVLSLIVFASLALQLILVRLISLKSADYFRRRQAALADVNGFIEEMIAGQKVIKVFNHEEATLDNFNFKNQGLRKSGTMANAFSTLMMPVMMNLSHVQFAILAIIGSIFTIRGSFGMDIGTLVAFLEASRNFSQPVVQIAQQFNSLVAAVAGAERVFEILDNPVEVDEGNVRMVVKDDESYWFIPQSTLEEQRFPATGLPVLFNEADPVRAYAEEFKAANEAYFKDIFKSGSLSFDEAGNAYLPVRGDIRFINLVFGYEPDQTVIDDISLYAKRAQKIAFVGSTGAGKTTIVNLMNRFYEIREGSILFDGIDIRDIKKQDLRAALGMVLQDIHLFSGTVEDNIRYGRLDASSEEIVAAANYANAHDFIMSLPDGYQHQLSADGSNLSQGQRQLLSIARAAVKDPEVLILDEATSSVDTRTERHIERGMDQLMEGRTSFAIAHRLSTVRHADAILLLENGKIIERGNHDELMEKGGQYYALNTGKAKLS